MDDLIALLDQEPLDRLLLLAIADAAEEEGRMGEAKAWRAVYQGGFVPVRFQGLGQFPAHWCWRIEQSHRHLNFMVLDHIWNALADPVAIMPHWKDYKSRSDAYVALCRAISSSGLSHSQKYSVST